MLDNNARRIVGGLSAFAVAAGFAVTAGVGAANAESKSVSWDDGGRHFTRTISNVTPAVGETITSTTRFTRSGGVEYLYAMKDVHPTCLEYVPGSAKVNGKTRTPSPAPDAASVRVEGGKLDWPVYPNASPDSWTLEVSYMVGEGCDRGTPLMTTAHMGGSSGKDGTYQDKGPTLTVAKDATTTTLAAIPSARVGEPVSLSATVSGAAEGDSVEFFDGETKLGSVKLDASGTATFSWTPATNGTHEIQARYVGSATANPSQAQAQSVSVVSPTSTTVSGPADATTGTPVTFTASVTPAGAQGRVQFSDGRENIGGPVDVVNGTATLAHTFTTAGGRSISAEFLAGSGYVNSTSAQAHSVTVTDPIVATTMTLDGPATAETGTEIDLTATVDPADAQGAVQFTDNDVPIGAPVTVRDGKAVLPHTFTAAGAHTIGATFTAAAGYRDASAETRTVQVSTPVAPDVDSTTVVTVPVTGTIGTSVTLSATVAPVDAQGTVRFYDGDTPIGDAVPVVDGTVTVQHTFTTAGEHVIIARYSGGEGVEPSTSTPQSIQVTAAGDNGNGDNGGNDTDNGGNDKDNGGGNTGSLGSLGNIFGSLSGIFGALFGGSTR
ncbi:Ig-like domain-containing protein [Prescottella subtropica]|uniref:Ig-like domain-containing protein n=1 Tax=Prescottella subtropica TaxID=2545757 RepID=UPI0010F7555D|nr:Ig-like domain-containing protein [Prescottella subtropica]